MTPFPGPAVAAIGERLLDRIDALADELTGVIRAAEPFYDAGKIVPVDDLGRSVRDNLAYILSRLAGQPAPSLKRYSCVMTAMHDEGRYLDLGQERTHFHFAIRQKITCGVGGRA